LLTSVIAAGKVFKIHNLTDVDATLLEPASCAAHGLEKIAPKMGSRLVTGPKSPHTRPRRMLIRPIVC
jgi:hypothetical protein